MEGKSTGSSPVKDQSVSVRAAPSPGAATAKDLVAAVHS
jgi:hypothetical protein